MKKVVCIFILALGFAWNCQAQTWTYLQDSIATACSSGNTACNVNQGNNVLPTTAGSVMIVGIHTQNNVTITSVSGGGGTWLLCPASSCHIFNSGLPDNSDLAYNLSGAGGARNITVTLSGAASGFFGADFTEFLPPSGATASFDVAGTAGSSSCTPTCTGPTLSISSTDLIFQSFPHNGSVGQNAWQSFSAPYITDQQNNGICFNCTSGAAPTVGHLKSTGGTFSSIAFKTSLGTYTPPVQPMSVVNYTAVQTGINCNPSCSFSIPSTGTAHLLYLEAGSSSHISSVSGGGTWTVPSGCLSTATGATGGSISCAYVLSSVSGATSISVTMSGSASTAFALWEIASTAGSFSLDTLGTALRSGSPALTAQGVPLTLNGTNPDVIFQSTWMSGGTNTVSLYPQPLNPNGQGTLFFSTATSANAANAALLNTTNGTAPIWINGGNNSSIAVTGVAFRTGTTGTAPAPPTGLAAVVN